MTETQAKWSERVREWRGSGGSAEEFAEGRGFKGSTLRFWASSLRKLERGPRATSQASVRLLRVVRKPSPASGSPIEVAVGAARIVVRPGFDAMLLRQLVEALGGAT
jgi:transposase